MPKRLTLIFSLVSVLFSALAAAEPPIRRDDPLGRMCWNLQRQGICSDVCKIYPPHCVSAEEAAKKRACAIGLLNGTLNEKCEPVVLPLPPGAPNEDLSIASQVKRGVIYWNVWSTCKGCSYALDEVILYPDNTYSAFYHSTDLLKGKGSLMGGTGENGWAPLVQYAMGGVRFVRFNPKLCAAGAKSCKPAKNVIVVDDTKSAESRIYGSWNDFAKGEGDPFTCDISAEGAASCTFRFSPRK